MWSETVHAKTNSDSEAEYGYGPGTVETPAATYLWSTDKLDVRLYTKGGVNDCNEVNAKDIHLFPACNTCASLNYAGFAEGWRLPSQRIASHTITSNCDGACGRTYPEYANRYCASDRQLWDFGMENCSWDPEACTGARVDPCKPDYDRTLLADNYWSSTQADDNNAWIVTFNTGGTYNDTKHTQVLMRVRCFLGEWP